MVETDLDILRQTRRDLHQIPEIGFDLEKTSGYIKHRLVEMGYEPISTAKTGWIVRIPGEVEDAIAFRSDMDGLEITEAADHTFGSEHPGRMHACGHDGHMTMLLGLASYLAACPKPGKTIILIFQPAEEGPGGAEVILKEGLLEHYRIKEIYGIHLYPGLPEGTIGLCKGPCFARSGEFDIKIEGVSAHAGLPHQGRDALLAGAALASELQSIGGRFLDPLEAYVLNIGTFNSGEARNIVAHAASLTGTIRSYSQASHEVIKTKIREMASGVGLSYSVKTEVIIRDSYPEVNNDPALVDKLIKSFQHTQYEMVKPLMLSEDFAYYQIEIPGVFMLLGTGNEAKGFTHALHSEKFDFNEAVLGKGIEVYVNLLKAEGIL